MDEYIRREDAIKCIEGQCVDGKMWGNDEGEGTLIEAYSAIDDLMDIPAAYVAPVRHGCWERVIPSKSAAKWSTKVSCSVCHNVGYNHFKYCPNCGAKMDGGED